MSFAQRITVSGYINNSSNGDAIKNVNVFEANTGIGTISSDNGFYRLVLNKKQLSLKFTDKGYEDFSKNLELESDTTLMINLVPIVEFNQKDDERLRAEVEKPKNKEKRKRSK